MKIALLVYGSAHNSQASYSALRFAKASLRSGHEVYRVFFYGDAIYTGNSLSTPPQDELNLHAEWSELAQTHELDLVICIAAALRRGVLDEKEAQRFAKEHHNLGEHFTLSGLGQLADATQIADRLLTFGG